MPDVTSPADRLGSLTLVPHATGLATKDFKGMLISYVADQRGDLAHKAGIYRLKGRTPELIGTISEAGF